LRSLVAVLTFAAAAPTAAHDLERTRVSLAFARDGSFVLEVSNDPRWLALRLEPFARRAARAPAPEALGDVFIDRVVLFVDGHEVRPVSADYVADETVATYRLRGRLPTGARTLRWYYGLVVDPYPLVVRRADGRLVVEEVAGDAWSGPIDLTGQFAPPVRWPIYLVAACVVVAIGVRVRRRRPQHQEREDFSRARRKCEDFSRAPTKMQPRRHEVTKI
jgi:hypothetical protein